MRKTPRITALVIAALLLCALLPGRAPADVGLAGAAPWEAVSSFPDAYDLRTAEGGGKVSPVRSQDGYSTCWIMAATASLESCLLPGAVYDFSENNLANHQCSRLVFAADAEGRADSRLSTAYFARWDGPVLERDDRYPRPGRSREGLRAVLHVSDVLYLPTRSGPDDNAALKWAVMTYGGVDTAIAAVMTDKHMNDETHAYYTWESSLELNHHVTCVGWDDDYPAKNFATRPDGPGAFLFKNSWGTDWGDAGYFWISYYDANMGGEMAVFEGTERVSVHDAIYQHDALGWTASYGYGVETAWYASRFRCVGSGSLTAVAFYTPVPGTSYEVRVARTVAEVGAAAVVGDGTVAVAGYHTLALSTSRKVTAGDPFVVAVKVTTPGSTSPVPLEHPSRLIAPRSAPRQSYVSPDGSAWTDLTTLSGQGSSNVCLKAFVDAPSGRDERAPRAVVRSARVARGGTARVRFQLGDPAFSCASAVVVLKVLRYDGSVVKSRRVPAFEVGGHGTWRFTCRLTPGVYTLTVRAYDVAGHSQRVPDRARLVVTPGSVATAADVSATDRPAAGRGGR